MEILYLYVPSGQGMFSNLHVQFNSPNRTFLKNMIQPQGRCYGVFQNYIGRSDDSDFLRSL
ncbi:hypothetical protein TorRG33x02_285130 [Trema orientale]|uniref:Uncharacterized protein n=1 Tax=Trema orientale TaxID=63057 RepID=A0A2P5CGY4_TREOI|nr:hypothetical protein TorRG33x02_285130 [Trema orientale]